MFKAFNKPVLRVVPIIDCSGRSWDGRMCGYTTQIESGSVQSLPFALALFARV